MHYCYLGDQCFFPRFFNSSIPIFGNHAGLFDNIGQFCKDVAKPYQTMSHLDVIVGILEFQNQHEKNHRSAEYRNGFIEKE